MEYTKREKETLSMMQRTDFKNLSKMDVVGIISQMRQIRPKVAREVLAHFPEFVNLVNTSTEQYRYELDKIISSDDESLKKVYAIAEDDLSASSQSRKEFYTFAEKNLDDLSKCLDDPNLTWEQRDCIFEREREILKMMDRKDSEIRKHDEEVLQMVNKKDSEKRQFNWRTIGIVSSALFAVLGFGVSICGGNVNIGLPNNNRSGVEW